MRYPIALGLVLTLTCARPVHAQAPSSTAGVARTVAGFASAWNRHDMVAFGKLFAPDADFVNVGGQWWKGRASIQAHHAYSHGAISQAAAVSQGVADHPQYYGIFRTSTMTFDSTDVRLIRPDVAIARVAWHLMGDTRTSTMRRGMLLFVVGRNQGEWRITAAQNTEIERVVH